MDEQQAPAVLGVLTGFCRCRRLRGWGPRPGSRLVRSLKPATSPMAASAIAADAWTALVVSSDTRSSGAAGGAGVPGHRGRVRGAAGLAARFRTVALADVEGTGSSGAGLARHLAAAGIGVVEVDRADRQDRHRQGKSGPLDAVSAARAGAVRPGIGGTEGRSTPDAPGLPHPAARSSVRTGGRRLLR